MSFLRRHVFPLFGAGMTLAVGIALGAGPLQGDEGDGGGGADLSADNADLSDQVAALEASQSFSEAAIAGGAPSLLDSRLRGLTVTIVAFPDVSDDRVAAAKEAVKLAGGSTAVSVRLSDDLLDPGKKTYVSSVAASSMRGLDDLNEEATEDPYEQIGSLIARAYLSHGNVTAIDDEATKIDSEIQGARLVTVDDEPAKRGTLAIVLGDGEHGDDVSVAAAHLISASLIASLAGTADGTVVVTPTTGSDSGGLIDALGADAELDGLPVSTLNVSEGSAAEAATVFAVVAAAGGKPSAFGTDGSRVVLPPGMPALPED